MSQLDAALAALADPTRRAILARLAEGEATVQEIARPFAISQPAVSHHLKVLEEAGLIETKVRGTARPRRLRPEAAEAIWAWMTEFRRLIAARYDRLDAVLAAMDTGDATGEEEATDGTA